MLFSKEKKQNQKQKNAKTIVYNVTNSRNIVKKKLSNNTPEMKKLLDSSHTKLGHKQSPVIVFFFLYIGIGCTANAHSTVSKKCKW